MKLKCMYMMRKGHEPAFAGTSSNDSGVQKATNMGRETLKSGTSL